MKVTAQAIPEVLLFEVKIFRDDRGHFLESWRADAYREAGIIAPFVQDNVSVSKHGVVRGLHFQQPQPQGKLVTCLRGAVYDVAVDVRRGSPTFGRWVGAELSEQNGCQLWVPEGFAHGFQVLSDEAVFAYKCTAMYAPAGDRSVRWNDPAIGIEWPVAATMVSPKDGDAPALAELPADALPTYQRLA